MEPSNQAKTNKIKFSIDMRLIILVLLAVIAGMLMLWRPWSSPTGDDRVISVSGTAKLTAEPDEFVFYPSYEFNNPDKKAALAELTKKSDEIVKKLKEIGVTDNKIKTDSSGYNHDFYFDPKSGENRYSLRLTITVDDKELAQKVQDYLLSTAPTGSVSPQASFSDGKQKELEKKARDEATRNAREKAEQSARNLGFKIGKVKSIDDAAGFGGIMPIYGRAMDLSQSSEQEDKARLSLQPGENELTYSVTVIYFVR